MSIVNALMVSLDTTDEEKLSKDNHLLNFAKKFVNAPPDKRKSILESAEKVWGSSNDEHERLALEFIGNLCKEADIRDGESRGA